MPQPPRPLLTALGILLLSPASHAATLQTTDFTGAWRLDDRNSDTVDTLNTAMRNEARREQQASINSSTAASSPASATSGDDHSGGHHGGMGRGGGMGGGGMGGGGMAGGQGGGGHGGRHGGDTPPSKPSAGDKDPFATASYPLPPLLNVDSVLLVQQDAKTFQVRLNNGDQLSGKLDGQPHQSLNGNAIVRGHLDAGRLLVSIQYADGTQLDQTWSLSPDGQQLVVSGAWKPPQLQEPVTFKRSYVGLH